MKPIKNRFFCYECNRPKMLFTSEKKAMNFIKFNANEIKEENGRAPIRAYYCETCGGWHVTSMEAYYEPYRSRTKIMVDQYYKDVENNAKNNKIKLTDTIYADRTFFNSIEKVLEKAEANVECGNLEKAKNYCYNIIDRLRANISYIHDKVRYTKLLERLTKCIEHCRKAKDWISETKLAIEDAFWNLNYGIKDKAVKSFQDAIKYLTIASDNEEQMDMVRPLFFQLEQLQTSLQEANCQISTKIIQKN